MEKQKKEPTFIFHIQIEDKEPVNMDSLSQEKMEEIGKRLYKNLVEGLGYKEVKK